MKLYIKLIYAFIIGSAMSFCSVNADAAPLFPGERNSLELHSYLSGELLRDPAGVNAPLYIKKLTELSRAAGREKTSETLRVCEKQMEESGDTGNISYMVMKFAEEELSSVIPADGIEKWHISGPWQRYGKPDIDYIFPVEQRAEDIRLKKISSKNSRIYPFGSVPERRGVVYASTSFATAIQLRIWIISNAGYKLFINGKESISCRKSDNPSLSEVAVKGATGYTLMIKIADNPGGEDPYFRVLVTDSVNKPVAAGHSSVIYSGSFFQEKEYSSLDAEYPSMSDLEAKLIHLRELISMNKTETAFKEGMEALALYPSFFGIYEVLLPLLDSTGHDREFIETINLFRREFPDSDYYHKWNASFYLTRDQLQFAGAMGKIHDSYSDHKLSGEYIKYLSGRGDYQGAAGYSERFSGIPSFRGMLSDLAKKRLSPEEWRKHLIEMIASTGDPIYYYRLGAADMEAGLDPVLYWEKGLSIRSDMRDLREAADAYENGSVNGNIFYSGKFADYYPEFLWNGIKRKVIVRIFENGKFMIECEDLIPASLSEKSDFKLLSLPEMRVLYAVRGLNGSADRAEYELYKGKDGSSRIKLKGGADPGFVAVKYTGYSSFEQYPGFIMKEMELKGADEKISEVEFEVISEGWIMPGVVFMDKALPGKNGDKFNEVKFSAAEKFNAGYSSRSSASIRMFSSDKEFVSWYSGLLKIRKGGVQNAELTGATLKDKTENLKKYITDGFENDGLADFAPDAPEDVYASKHGTSEELAILARALLEKGGVRSFIAFIRNSGGVIDGETAVTLYIPESKGKGFWLDFSNRIHGSNSEALIIKGDGYEIIPFTAEGGR